MVQKLRSIKHTNVPRYLFFNEKEVVRTELHTFCYASEEAFAAAV